DPPGKGCRTIRCKRVRGDGCDQGHTATLSKEQKRFSSERKFGSWTVHVADDFALLREQVRVGRIFGIAGLRTRFAGYQGQTGDSSWRSVEHEFPGTISQ